MKSKSANRCLLVTLFEFCGLDLLRFSCLDFWMSRPDSVDTVIGRRWPKSVVDNGTNVSIMLGGTDRGFPIPERRDRGSLTIEFRRGEPSLRADSRDSFPSPQAPLPRGERGERGGDSAERGETLAGENVRAGAAAIRLCRGEVVWYLRARSPCSRKAPLRAAAAAES